MVKIRKFSFAKAEPRKEATPVSTSKENHEDKQVIDLYRKKIQEKLKDPKNAKKAAVIIEEILKKAS